MGSRRLRTALLALVLGCGPADSPPPAAPAPVAPGPAGPPPAGPAPSAAVVPGTVDLDRAPPTEEVRTAAAAPCAGCDIVVISVCSLRRDHVGAYGVIDGLTPSIDRLAAESVRFDTAYAGSNFTLASLTALLTGRFGSSTGVVGWGKGLGDGVPTLPEVLGFYGYRTGAFTVDAASGLRPDYGLDRGFQRMRVVPPPPGTPDGRHTGTGSASPGASAVIYGGVDAGAMRFEGVEDALAVPETELRLFGKPESFVKRRMGVALARGGNTDEARDRAKLAASLVKPKALS